MRSEHEMMKLILDFAQKDDNIRAAYMNGSRANPKIPKDDHQDYDVVFACQSIDRYLDDHGWIDTFGKVAILQEADKTEQLFYQAKERPNSYCFLILYQDDVRTDIVFKTVDQALLEYGSDSATILLLDKDHRFKQLPEASDLDYRIRRPSEYQVTSCINEFFWCLQNVAKGLARDQVPYALWMMNGPIRDMQTRMIEWFIAKDHDFDIATGSHGKQFKKFLSPELYQRWEMTVSDAKIDHVWASTFAAIDLFSEMSHAVCEALGYSYNIEEELQVTAHLKRLYTNTKSDP